MRPNTSYINFQTSLEQGLTRTIARMRSDHRERANGRIRWSGASRAEACNFARKMCNLNVTHIAP
jgi:hypothetical protein